MHFNSLDWGLLALLVLAVWDGGRRGFAPYASELGTFAVSVAAAFAVFQPVGFAISRVATVPAGVAGFGVFLFVVVLGHGILLPLLQRACRRADAWITGGRPPELARLAGIVPALACAGAVGTLALGALDVLPSTQSLRSQITASQVASAFARAGDRLPIQALLDPGAVPAAVAAQSSGSGDGAFYHLSYPANLQLQLDPAAEDRMLELINQERAAHGLPPVIMDAALRRAARDHSRDMYVRGYFSHVTPDGLTPFDRMKAAGVQFVTAGENIALAPEVDQAEASLMASPEHRANILDPDFRRVGIGVWEGLGGYEEMFTQDFADNG